MVTGHSYRLPDDLAMTAVGKYPEDLCDLVQGALYVVETWFKEAGINVDPAKRSWFSFQ